ncbi:DUF924 domain-containing protein [Cyanobium sp. FGCU-6]|nr:DUF924 domain-containing protein [Cyanobium sp. FGCU6]
MPVPGKQAAEVLEFWFVQSRPRQWFAKDPAFDALLRERFLGLTRRAIAGELDAWGREAAGGLALVLLLDQVPRQIWRGTAMAFAGDPQALALSLRAVELGWLEAEPEQARRQFWLMPLMHSEDLAVQEAALPLFERYSDPRTADFARRHRDVIAHFGRFPQRNSSALTPWAPERWAADCHTYQEGDLWGRLSPCLLQLPASTAGNRRVEARRPQSAQIQH